MRTLLARQPLSIILMVIPLVIDEFSNGDDRPDPIAPPEMECTSIRCVCTSPNCLEVNANLAAKVKLSANPCDDFYDYACGKFEGNVDDISVAVDIIQKDVFADFQTPPSDKDYRAKKLAKEMYQYCVKHGECDSAREDAKELIHYLGGWPLLEPNWNESAFSLETFIAKSLERGYNPNSLFTVDVYPSLQNSTQKAIRIMQPFEYTYDIIFPTAESSDDTLSSLLNAKRFDLPYVKAIKRLFNMSKQWSEKSFDEFDSIRTQLLYPPNVQDPDNETLTLGELKDRHCNIPWLPILRSYFAPVAIHNDELVILDCRPCLDELNDFLGNVAKRDLANYLMWSMAIKTSIEIEQIDFKYSKYFTENPGRERYCAAMTTQRFRRVVDYEFIQGHFHKNYKKEIARYGSEMKKVIGEFIANDPALDSTTKAGALNKLHNVILKVCWDSEINTQQQVEEYYADLDLNPKSYYLALFNLTKFVTKKQLATLRELQPSVYLEATSSTPSAYNYPHNTVLISATFGQTYAYAPQGKPYFTYYAGLGAAIAREISRAFDPRGSRYDWNGDNVDWWNLEAKRKFDQRYECFQRQYFEFVNVETGHKVNGLFTLDANIADNAGIMAAYKRYEQYLREHNETDVTLFDYQTMTPRQLFWLYAASLMCKKSTKDEVAAREKYALTAENRNRVNGMVMNSESFARDYKCKSGDPMNPRVKCKLWE